MRRALLFGAAALVGCGSTPAPSVAPVAAPSASAVSIAPTASASGSSADAGAPSSRQARLVARMLQRVEAARGFRSKKPVPGVTLDRATLIAQVRAHVDRELPPDAIADEGTELALFGFIPTDFDYEGAEYALLQDQLAGYYEPADGTMYLASDLGDEEANATLAHELVHALQDQRWNLGDRSKYHAGQGDRSEAVSALAEGDATSAMFDVMIAKSYPGSGKTAVDMPDDVFIEQIRAGMNDGPGKDAPHVMRTSLVAPYVYGTVFVNALRRQAGWSAVDHAWDDPPTTSEQILHVGKWSKHEPALPVAAPPFATLGAGWTAADEDTEGELGVRLAFEEWTDARTAAEVSPDWGGDRGVLVRSGDQSAFAWRLRYDSTVDGEAHAAAAWKVLVKALDKTLGAPKGSDAAFDCHERADRGPLAASRAGKDLVLTLGPAHVAKGGWSSAGDCALARRWAREIAASK